MYCIVLYCTVVYSTVLSMMVPRIRARICEGARDWFPSMLQQRQSSLLLNRRYSIVKYCTVVYCTVQYCTVECSYLLYSIAEYSIVQ